MTTMTQVLNKQYECYRCHKPIKVSKIDNAAPGQKQWNQFELDGITSHVCSATTKEGTTSATTVKDTVSTSQRGIASELSDISKRFESIEFKINTLIAQVQNLRTELKNNNGVNK